MRREVFAAMLSLCLAAPLDRSLAAEETATTATPAPTKADQDAFLVAARHGRIEQVKALLAKGIKPDQPRDHNGNLALGLAVLEGQLETVKLLIENGADPKNDILKYCSYQENVIVASYLVEKGAGQKASELIAHDVPLVFYTEKPAFRKLLIEKTATDPNLRHNGQTLLINCIKLGMTDVVRLLLEKGADPTVAAANGDTPLKVAQTAADRQPALAQLIEAALARRQAASAAPAAAATDTPPAPKGAAQQTHQAPSTTP